jgi:GNAT superfamily N-acetyltransferase
MLKQERTWQKENYLISTDKKKLDHVLIYDFLTHSYWAEGRTQEAVSVSIENAVCFGVYLEGEQVGFARVVTDFATIAYLADVFVLPAHRGKGIGRWLVESILTLPELEKNAFWLLLTEDAQWLYQLCGFRLFHSPEGVMVRKGKKI